MNAGRFVLTQVLDVVHRQSLDRLVHRYEADSRTRHFGCRQQLICMAFAQLTWRESLRDIETCLNAKPQALYHLGFSEPIARSTLADANEGRNWQLWRDLAQQLITRARRLYVHDDLGLEFDNTVYALDSTTIDLSLTLFPWAHFRSTKAGIKLHTQLDLRGPIPTVVDISPARQHDVRWLDELVFESGAFYIIDRGYLDFARLANVARAGAFFVTRAKDNLRFTRHYSRAHGHAEGVRGDQVGRLAIPRSRRAFPWPLRRVRYFDAENRRELLFLTNHIDLPAPTVARLYQLRWQVELFFRWIKQNLRIKHFYGNSPNAVKTQVWIAVAVYVMIAILHKQLGLPGTLHRTMQILSVHPFEKVPIQQLLTECDPMSAAYNNPNQLSLNGL
jgi:hypothetical protein